MVVTGGNAGIGYGTVKAFVSNGAAVIIASRNQDKMFEAVSKIKKMQPDAKV